jgi:hypothetical protein
MAGHKWHKSKKRSELFHDGQVFEYPISSLPTLCLFAQGLYLDVPNFKVASYETEHEFDLVPGLHSESPIGKFHALK